MRSFFKYVLATIVGIICVSAFMFIMGLIMLASVAMSGDTKPVLENGSVLRISLNGQMVERAQDNPFSRIMGEEQFPTQGLDDVLKAIKVAKTNDKVKGIYLEGGMLGTDYATLQTLRKALIDFKQSKKFVLAYADSYGQGAYYVASAADKMILNPSGMLDWHGIASQPIFYTDLLKKIGVEMQVFKVGTFKSAVEPFILTQMSDANREQVKSFIGDIWQVICKDVAVSRKLPVDSLNAYADRYSALADAEDWVKMKMVDSVSYVDGVRDFLRKLSGQEKVKLISAADLAKLEEPVSKDKSVAVYYAQGDIVDGMVQNPLVDGSSQIVGSKVVADLDKLANDDNIKAVVLRINSGGGSAYASEQMWRAIQLLKAKKPIVVSMGGMAASGGYYMSCSANCIYAEPTTLTGSIGIFGMIPDASGLLRGKLGLNFDMVKTNQSADFGAMGRAFNAEEAAAMQGFVDRGYRLFLKRVAEGRNMKVEDVDKIAQGRVWTGNQALKIKLVDKLGTLDEAVAEAARLAKLKDYAVESYPAKASWLDQFKTQFEGENYMEQKLRMVLGEYYEPLHFVGSLDGKPSMQARIFFVPNLK